MAGSECGNCEAVLTAGVRLCHDCTCILEHHLKQVVDVWATLQTTLERRDVGAASVGLGVPGHEVGDAGVLINGRTSGLSGVV